MYYVLALPVLAAAAFMSARFAYADAEFRKATPEGIAHAVALEPRNAGYLAIRALQMQYDGGDATALWQRIAALNPMSSAPRIRLGLDAELRGEPSAEAYLLDAARVDRQFEPRWTLANFYFRAGRVDDFWKWTKLALENSYGDLRPVFDLCLRVDPDPLETLRRAIPERATVAASFLSYAIVNQKSDAVLPAAEKLASLDASGFGAALLGADDVLLDAGRFADAQTLWIALGHNAPDGVMHPDLDDSGSGFNWRWTRPPGVAYVPLQGALRLQLSGTQPESAVLLRQPIAGSHTGRLHWESRTSGIHKPSGLEWRIAGQRGEIEPSDDWRPGSAAVPRSPMWLELVYQRPQGEARAQGTVELRHVRISAD